MHYTDLILGVVLAVIITGCMVLLIAVMMMEPIEKPYIDAGATITQENCSHGIIYIQQPMYTGNGMYMYNMIPYTYTHCDEYANFPNGTRKLICKGCGV